MQALLEVILPVFLVIGAGYLAVWRGLFSDAGVDGLMVFTQKFAIPALLFRAISTIDLSQSFDWPLLSSFYTGAISGFVLGMLGARFLFARPWADSVAIGFIGLFSNTLLLGLPITERAYGADALQANYAIIAIHSPLLYGIGITAMELVRNRGGSPRATLLAVLRAMFSNALVVGIALGFAVNLSGVALPGVFTEAVDLITRAALPAALFGLGGVLVRYRPEGDMPTVLYVCALSLLVHPLITAGLGRLQGLDVDQFRSAVLTAAMAPGVNVYVFANIYGVGKRVAATAVLVGTTGSLLTVWLWLSVLP